MISILFSARAGQWDDYAPTITSTLDAAGVAHRLAEDMPVEEVDYIIYSPASGLTDFSVFPKLKAVLSLWAGVERIVGNPTLKVPLTRLVDQGLTEGMVEWVTGHVLRYHLGIDTFIAGQDGKWRDDAVPPLARDRKVGVLGLGALGAACANALAALNFAVSGWSRSPKTLPGIRCESGEEGLDRTLSRSEILVLLLPATPATESLLNVERLARLPKGAAIINPGRGPLIDDDALIAALDTGHIGHATLDVFRVEPLPADHPFWAHPRITVTPHIASVTRSASAARTVAENIAGHVEHGRLDALVDRDLGY